VKFWEGKKTVWQALKSCNNNVNVAKSLTFYGWADTKTLKFCGLCKEKDQFYRVMKPMLAWAHFLLTSGCLRTYVNLLNFSLPTRVDWLVIEHLNVQGRPDPRARLHCFWCSNKTWTPLLGASDTLTIVKNSLEMTKLRSPKVKGVKNSKNQTTEHYKAQFLNTKKFFLCCSVAIRVPQWFVKFQRTLL